MIVHGGCDDTGAAEPLYGGCQGEGYETGNDSTKVSFLSGTAFPCSGQKVAGQTGYCLAKV